MVGIVVVGLVDLVVGLVDLVVGIVVVDVVGLVLGLVLGLVDLVVSRDGLGDDLVDIIVGSEKNIHHYLS